MERCTASGGRFATASRKNAWDALTWVVDDDIRGADQRLEGVLVVNDDRPFVPVCIGMHHATLETRAVIQERWFRAERVAMRRLRQDHVGAEVPEQTRGESAGQSVGQVHNANSIECCRHTWEIGRDAIGLRIMPYE